jgi:hypothetical protein
VDITEVILSDHNEQRRRSTMLDEVDRSDTATAAAGAEVAPRDWWTGVNAARTANDDHMGEEEHEGPADFRRHVELDLRHPIAVSFAAYETEHADGVPIEDKDPEQYIRDYS